MRWKYLHPDPAMVERLALEANVPPLMARLLLLRGVRSAAESSAFLSPSLEQLHSPYLMRGMREAVERISAAIANREDILIYGDYDVDGTVSVVILRKAIELAGGEANYHVPHRIRDGYGMRGEVIERAAALFEMHIADDAIHLTIAPYPALTLVQAEQNRLEQVFVNLLSNAFDAVQGHSDAEVETVIRKGNGRMPAFANLQAAEIAAEWAGLGAARSIASRLSNSGTASQTVTCG